MAHLHPYFHIRSVSPKQVSNSPDQRGLVLTLEARGLQMLGVGPDVDNYPTYCKEILTCLEVCRKWRKIKILYSYILGVNHWPQISKDRVCSSLTFVHISDESCHCSPTQLYGFFCCGLFTIYRQINLPAVGVTDKVR